MSAKREPMELPWTLRTAPHAVLDILRGCNIRCRACYNRSSGLSCRSLEQVKDDYEKIMAFRPVSTFGLIGGEPLLHPELLSIIRFLKERKHAVEIFTNGLLLTPDLCRQLAEAGVDLVFLHIGLGQIRKDLADCRSAGEVFRLRTEKAKMLCSAGIEAAFSVTLQRDTLNELPELVRYFLSSPYMTYCLVTLFRDTEKTGLLTGSLEEGITGTFTPYSSPQELSMEEVLSALERTGMRPFTRIMNSVSGSTPGWVNCMSAVHHGKHADDVLQCSPSGFEKRYIARFFRKHGRFPFYNKQNPLTARAQLLLNGLCGNRKNFPFLLRNIFRHILMKRLIVQSIAHVAPDGRLDYCRNCPDITVRNGKIVPVCVCDNMMSEHHV